MIRRPPRSTRMPYATLVRSICGSIPLSQDHEELSSVDKPDGLPEDQKEGQHNLSKRIYQLHEHQFLTPRFWSKLKRMKKQNHSSNPDKHILWGVLIQQDSVSFL